MKLAAPGRGDRCGWYHADPRAARQLRGGEHAAAWAPPRSDGDDRENAILFCRDAFEKTLSAMDAFVEDPRSQERKKLYRLQRAPAYVFRAGRVENEIVTFVGFSYLRGTESGGLPLHTNTWNIHSATECVSKKIARPARSTPATRARATWP